MMKKGSCRFQSYFKIEVWHETLACWKPIQRSYATAVLAEGAASQGRFRIMECDESGFSVFKEGAK